MTELTPKPYTIKLFMPDSNLEIMTAGCMKID